KSRLILFSGLRIPRRPNRGRERTDGLRDGPATSWRSCEAFAEGPGSRPTTLNPPGMTHGYSHNHLVLAWLLEFGAGGLAIAFLVGAVMWWREARRARHLGAAIALVACLASAGISTHNRTYLTHARAVLCTPG